MTGYRIQMTGYSLPRNSGRGRGDAGTRGHGDAGTRAGGRAAGEQGDAGHWDTGEGAEAQGSKSAFMSEKSKRS